MFNSETYNSERLIITLDFKTQVQAIERMNSLNYGVIKKSQYGCAPSLTINEINGPSRDDKNDLYFESETKHGFYYHTIEDHKDFFRLNVYTTKKHKMITAAMTGDIDLFVENFTNTDKMKGFALSTAITNGHWNIVKYLTDNHDLKDRPLWEAIKYNKVEILKKLIDSGCKLPKDWLAYCIYSDSIDVTRELILKRKIHLTFATNELKTNWFQREINKKSKTAELVKELLK